MRSGFISVLCVVFGGGGGGGRITTLPTPGGEHVDDVTNGGAGGTRKSPFVGGGSRECRPDRTCTSSTDVVVTLDMFDGILLLAFTIDAILFEHSYMQITNDLTFFLMICLLLFW